MGTTESQITSLTIVYSAVYSDADQRKHQSSASLAFVPGIHRGPVNSPHKWSVTRKMFPFDDVIMLTDVTAASMTPVKYECKFIIMIELWFPISSICIFSELLKYYSLFSYQSYLTDLLAVVAHVNMNVITYHVGEARF